MEMAQNAPAQNAGRKIRVLIVDDSPLMCKVMRKILDDDPDIEVVGHVLSGQEALKALGDGKCDVCTLDVHMPGMNGLTVLKHIMIRCPLPTVMVSAFTADGAHVTFEALRYGAVDFFHKPSQESGQDLFAQGEMLRRKIKRASRVQVSAARYLRLKPTSAPQADTSSTGPGHGLIVLTASTGGYAALLALLPSMGAQPACPMIISLGTPIKYLDAFVDYLKPFTPFPVVRGGNGEALLPGRAYCISGEEAASVEREGDQTFLRVTPRVDLSEKEGGVDLLMFSASELYGTDLLSVFLSGDGTEGESGASEIHRNGGTVWIQKPESCLAPDLPAQIGGRLSAPAMSLTDLSRRLAQWREE